MIINKALAEGVNDMLAVQRFAQSLISANIPFALALTGSSARGEFRNNTRRYDYFSDTDVLCIVDSRDISRVLLCKANLSTVVPLILMNADALKYPSNAVLSIAFDSVFSNGLELVRPSFHHVDPREFIAYQLQPLAYYYSQLRGSSFMGKRRLYSKIAITCLKLLYLVENRGHRDFIFESMLSSLSFKGIEDKIVRALISRDLSDQALQRAANTLQATIKRTEILIESADVLASTTLYLNDVSANASHIREAVFLENNKLTLSQSLSLMS